MAEIIEFYGEWFLPGNIDLRVKGILTHNPVEQYSILKLLGEFDNYKQHFQPAIILGITDDDVNITLYNCYLAHHSGITNKSPLFEKSSKQSRTEFKIRYILEGFHFHSVEEMKFNKITSEILYLDDWLKISGFLNNGANFSNEIIINYKFPEPILFEVEEYAGKISFGVKESAFWPMQKSVEIKQEVYFSLKSNTPKSFEELSYELFKFQNFLVLSLYTHTNPISIELFTEDFFFEHITYTGKTPHLKKNIIKIPKSIKLYFPIRKVIQNQKPKNDWQMLFSYRDIENDFPLIIKNWYEKYAILKPSFDLVFEQFYSIEKVLETTFLGLAQAVETLHAKLNPGITQIPKDEFDILKKIVKDALPEGSKEFANGLNNNYYLSLRLQDVLDKYSTPFLLDIVKDTEQFLKDIKESRNYYTHYNPNIKKGLPIHLEGFELVVLRDKLMLLIVSAFLIEIGFTKDKLQSFFTEKADWMFSHLK